MGEQEPHSSAASRQRSAGVRPMSFELRSDYKPEDTIHAKYSLFHSLLSAEKNLLPPSFSKPLKRSQSPRKSKCCHTRNYNSVIILQRTQHLGEKLFWKGRISVTQPLLNKQMSSVSSPCCPHPVGQHRLDCHSVPQAPYSSGSSLLRDTWECLPQLEGGGNQGWHYPAAPTGEWAWSLCALILGKCWG